MTSLRLLLLTCLSFATALPVFSATPVTPVPAFAAARLATVKVRVAPDHRD